MLQYVIYLMGYTFSPDDITDLFMQAAIPYKMQT